LSEDKDYRTGGAVNLSRFVTHLRDLWDVMTEY
jgi:hypothetical protein